MSGDRRSGELGDTARHLPLPHVPEEVSERLRALFGDRLPVVAGSLVSDTRSGGQLVGARGGASVAWTMVYEAGRCGVLFDIAPAAGRLRVTGRLACPEPPPGAVVRAYGGEELVAATSTDDVGQFDLSVLLPGVYTVAAITTHDVVELVVDLTPGITS